WPNSATMPPTSTPSWKSPPPAGRRRTAGGNPRSAGLRRRATGDGGRSAPGAPGQWPEQANADFRRPGAQCRRPGRGDRRGRPHCPPESGQAVDNEKKLGWKKPLEPGEIRLFRPAPTAQVTHVLAESVSGGPAPATFATLEKKR